MKGSYYRKKKIRGVKKVSALTTATGENIYDRKLAAAALKAWVVRLETSTLADGKKTFREWFKKLKETWSGKAPATVAKIDYAIVCIQRDYEDAEDCEGEQQKKTNLLELPLDSIKSSQLSTFFANLSKRLGAMLLME